MASRTRSRISVRTTGMSLRTRETVATLTPACRATSRMGAARPSLRPGPPSTCLSLTTAQLPALDSHRGEMQGCACSTGSACLVSETGYSPSNVGPWRRGRMRGRFGLGAAIAVALCSLVVAACGGSDSGGSSSSGGGGGAAAGGSGGDTTSGAKVLDPNLANGAKGTVTYCQGKDTAGNAHAWVKAYNAKNTGITVKLLE